MDTATLAYVAAVVDTFANLRLRQVERAQLPEVQVNCPNLALLEWLGEITGTTPFTTKRDYMRHGCAQHCEEAHQHIKSRSGRWGVTGVRATVLLINIEPHLRFRRAEALDLIEHGMAVGWKSHTAKSMADLGWAVPTRQAGLRSA